MKFRDERSGKLVVVAHCVLNQNSRVSGLADYPAVINELVDFLIKNNVGFLQMPCPELTYAGARRPSRTKKEYDTTRYRYRKYCEHIAVSTANILEEFAKSGVAVLAVLGIEGSPSCGVGKSADETGILMEELMLELKRRRLILPFYAVNTSEIAADIKWLEKIVNPT